MYQSPLHLAGLAAIAAGDVAASAPYALLTNGAIGYVLYVPVPARDASGPPRSILGAAVDAGAAYAKAAGSAASAFAISVVDVTAEAAAVPGVGTVFATGGAPAVSSDVAPASVQYIFLNRTWSLIVSPSPAFLVASLNPGQFNVLGFGIPLVAVAGVSARLPSAPPRSLLQQLAWA